MTLTNKYKPYLVALQDAGATTILEPSAGIILAGFAGKNFVFDIDRNKKEWNGFLFDVSSPEDCVKIINEG